MLKSTHREEKQVLENCSGNDKVVQVELEGVICEHDSQNVEIYSSRGQEHHSVLTSRPKRIIKPPARYGFEDTVSYALIFSSQEPTIFQETISSPKMDKWMEVMMEEIESLYKNQTWELEKLLKEKRAKGCK